MPSFHLLSTSTTATTLLHDRFVYCFLSTLLSFHPNYDFVCLHPSFPLHSCPLLPITGHLSNALISLTLIVFCTLCVHFSRSSVHEYGRLLVCSSQECFPTFFFGFSVQFFLFSLNHPTFKMSPVRRPTVFFLHKVNRAIWRKR